MTQRGPDLVLAGAARSGTTRLAARLAAHPDVVSPSIKEPNYFSSRLERGYDWYAGLYPRSDGMWLDASAQYTFPSHLEALARAADLSSGMRVVYLVREPIRRAYSHYCQEVLYLGKLGGADFGQALHLDGDIAGASDYALVLEKLQQVVPADRLLVLPFELIIEDLDFASELAMSFSGLDAALVNQAEPADALYANEAAVIGNPIVRRTFNAVRSTRMYPQLRKLVGAERMRAARKRLTSSDAIPSLEEALSTCTPADLSMFDELTARAATAVTAILGDQDSRRGTDLARMCAWTGAAS